MPDDPRYDIGTRLIDYDQESYDEHLVYYQSVIELLAEKEIEINKYKIGRFINSYQFEIPEYQRDYEWEQPQWADLWTEIEKLFDADLNAGGAKTADVFFGSIFFADRGTTDDGNTTRVEVIDGQQRLTTLSLAFKAIRDVVTELDPETDQATEIREGLIAKIDNILYLESSIPGRKPPALVLNDHNSDFYEALVGTQDKQLDFIRDARSVHGNRRKHAIQVHEYAQRLGVPESKYEELEDDNKHFDNASDRLLRAYSYFREQFEEQLSEHFPDEDDKQVKALTNVTNYVLNSFIVGYFRITSSRSSLMMSVFQILNDRGMNLKKVDIIRARLVSRLRDADADPEASTEIAGFEEMIENLNNDYSDVEGFLVDYLAANEDGISSKGDVSKHLLEAFEETGSRNANIDSVMGSVEDAVEFIEAVKTYSKYYHEIIDPDAAVQLQDDAYQTRANEIITRLDQLGYEQWRPLVLLVYGQVRETGSEAHERYFVRLLRFVEKVSFRVSLTNVYPSVQDPIYIEACQRFRADPFSEDLFTDALERLRTRSNQLFGESFADTVIEEYNWGATTAKTLLWKVSSDTFFERDGMIRSTLNVDSIHLEHVFPQTPFLKGDARYEWFRRFFRIDTEERVVQEILDRLTGAEAPSDADEQLEDVAAYFINDIANMVLLQSEENLSIGNRPFDEKIKTYYETEGFSEIATNEFFAGRSAVTVEGGAEETETTDVDWTYQSLTDRKAGLVAAILESLAFEEIDEEFKTHEISERVREETERRLGLIRANHQNVLD